MPLMKYVFFGGSALVLLLLAMNWLLPDPTAEAVYSSTKRPVIRISSIQTLPKEWFLIPVCLHRLRASCELRHSPDNRHLRLNR